MLIAVLFYFIQLLQSLDDSRPYECEHLLSISFKQPHVSMRWRHVNVNRNDSNIQYFLGKENKVANAFYC